MAERIPCPLDRPGRAFDLMFTGDIVEAEEAQRIGLLTRIFDGEAGSPRICRTHRCWPPLVMAEIKVGLRRAWSGVQRRTRKTKWLARSNCFARKTSSGCQRFF